MRTSCNMSSTVVAACATPVEQGGLPLGTELRAFYCKQPVVSYLNTCHLQAHNATLLKFMPNEDVSIGFWLMSVDLRRVDHQRVSQPDLDQHLTLHAWKASQRHNTVHSTTCHGSRRHVLLQCAGRDLGPPVLLRARTTQGWHLGGEPPMVPRHS